MTSSKLKEHVKQYHEIVNSNKISLVAEIKVKPTENVMAQNEQHPEEVKYGERALAEIVFFQEKIDKLLKGRSSSNENSNRSKRKSENDNAPEAKMGKLENPNVIENINELLAMAEELNVVREIPKSEIKSKIELESGLVCQDGPKIKLVPIEQLRNRTYQIENLRRSSYP